MDNQISCCCFDLETTNLSADFGIILCGVIKPANGSPIVIRGDRFDTWQKNRSNDRKTVKAIVSALEPFDIWIAHNGAKFDVPFLRTRLLRWGLDILPSKKLIDPVQLARNKLRMSFNSLSQVANHLGCNSKTEVKPQMWLRASMDGSSNAMSYIVEHCVEDVITLEYVIGKLKGYSTTFNTYGSGF